MLCARGGQKLSTYLCAHVSGFHTSKNFAEEERNGDARVSLLLLSSLMGFVGDYLAFAGVGCSPLACQSSCSCCLSLERRRREKEARRSELVLALLLACAAFACWREERIGGGARLTAGFRGFSLAGAVRCFA
ncbi:hypothetical protein KY289_020904 [Solanum tuberosum]|nr:hypothetical protein KY289_020904 [Solanum tuberosum]